MHLPWHDAAPGPGPVISTSVTGREAAQLTRLAAGRQVLEIGAAYGYSACVMALAGAERVTSVDPHQWIPQSLETMLANLGFYGVSDQVDIIREPSQQAMPWLERTGARFGLIFIDGDHGAPAARHDLRAALGLLEPGGVLAVHDYLEDCCCPGVREAADDVFPEGGDVTDTLLVVRP